MKTILVPTDFSAPAKNAARYTMHLAREMKANIRLCNAIMVPVDVPMEAHVSFPITSFEILEQETEKLLKQAAHKMEEQDKLIATPEDYHPVVEYVTGVGPVSDVICGFADKKEVSMVLMGMSGAGGVARFLLGSSSRKLIEVANFPVLLVPKAVGFKKINKIAFATDLSKEDVAVIHVLAGFARTFNAQILLVHIVEDKPEADKKRKSEIDSFLNEITNSVNYHKIYYQYVLDKDIENGLDWLAAYGQIQVLAMVHRRHNIFHKIFKGSYTQRLKRRIDIPLLVFPPDCNARVI